jgi:pimeloyl-ACP methyl ester carboxylesterase
MNRATSLRLGGDSAPEAKLAAITARLLKCEALCDVKLEQRVSDHVEKRVELRSGVTLPYVEQGDSNGIPMLLLHGVTDSWRSFEPVLPHLPLSIRAFALTQRGHGDADRPVAGYRTRDFAKDLAEFIITLGLGPTIVVGHSMGSTNAKRFAIDYPDLTLALVLAGSFASYRENPVVTAFWESSISQLTDPIDPNFVREFQESTIAQPIPPASLDTAVAESLKVPARVWRATFDGFMEDQCAPDLGKIASPTLILWGAHDFLCRRCDQDALLAAIPRSRIVVYENAGHALHWEEPQRFAADLVRFAESLDA